MNYGSAIGSEPFRQALADFLYRQTSEKHDIDCLALTGGNSMALSMAMQISCEHGAVWWCEDPTYFHMRSIFDTNRIEPLCTSSLNSRHALRSTSNYSEKVWLVITKA